MSRWREHSLRLGFAAMLAAILAALSFAVIKPLQADEAFPVDAIGGATPQSNPYGAQVTRIYFSSDPVYAGDATIYVDVRNLSSMGEATFRVILEIDPPGDDNTETRDLGTMAFGAPNSNGATKAFEKEYEFEETSLGRKYRLNAKVYSPSKDREFYEAATETSVKEVIYDADVGSISVSGGTIRQGDTATISARFTNQVRSNSGEGTFDIVFVVDPPGDDGPVELEVTGSGRNFSKNESKRLGKSYEFEHVGRHTIKAQIWNPDRSRKFDEVETTLDVKDPYGAEVTRIYFSSDPVYAGDATINVEVRNLSSTRGPFGGEATFALLLEVDPPGLNNTVTYELDSISFSRPGRTGALQTFSMSYPFKQTFLRTMYRFKATVYNPDISVQYAEDTKDISVNAVSYHAAVSDIQISRSSVYQGERASISAKFTNQVGSNSGEGTFDIVFVVDPPGDDGPVELEVTGSERNFSKNESKRLGKSYEFEHVGRHTIKAQIWNPDRSRRFGEVETTLEVQDPYDAEVSDISVSPSPLYEGAATISVTVRNLTAIRGADAGATFDVRLEVDPPGSNNTLHPADNDVDWDDVAFSAGESKTLTKSFSFVETALETSYRIKAEVYDNGGNENGWDSDHRIDDAAMDETFTVIKRPDPPSPDFEAGVSRVFPVRGMHVDQRATVNVDWFVHLNNPQNVTGPTFTLSASFYSQDDAQVPLPGTTSSLVVPVGASKSTHVSVPNPTEPGDYRLCASIGLHTIPFGDSDSDFDADSSNGSACTEVRILHDLGDDFSEGLVAFPFSDDRNEQYWVYLPDAYTQPMKVADAIDERTWGGFEHWNDRKNQYKHLALDIARRGQYISGRIILIDVPDEKKTEILNDLSINAEALADEFEPIDLAAEPVIENADHLVSHLLVANHITPEYADSVISHLGHASSALNTVGYIARYGPILLDIAASESVNRAIVVVDAEKILAALEALPMGDAWEEAIRETRADIAAMTSPDAMVRWAKAIEDHIDELAVATARVAATYAAKAAAGKLLVAAGLSGGPVTIIVAAVVAVIAAGYFAVDETGVFWDGMSLAATAAQVYSYLDTSDPETYAGDLDLQAKEDGRNLALDYTKFAFYQYLHDAADTSDLVPILGIEESLVRDKAKEISDQRDFALAGQLQMGWNPEEDFKDLDTKRPLDIWSDGQTMWAIDGQSLNDHLIHGYHINNKNLLPDKELKFGTTFLQLGVIPDVILSSANRSIWQDASTGTMWVMDNAGEAELFAYDTVQQDRDTDKEFDIGDIYPSDFSALKPIADAVYGTAALFTADASKPAPETLADSIIGQVFKSLGIDLEELLTVPEFTPGGIWSDGETMWFATEDRLYAYDLSGKSRVPNKDFLLDEDNTNALGLWSHDGTMWVSDGEDGMIYAYRMSDKSRDPANDLFTVKVPKIANNSSPTGIWSNGETMWVADYESDRIFAYTLPDSLSPPLDLTATVSGTGGDSQVDLTWQAPSDTGRTAITGYVMEESEDGLAWQQLVGNTGSTSTSYSDQRPAEWSVRHYRVAAINSSGAGPFSATVTALRTFGIVSIGCLPYFFYAGESVECSPTIAGDSLGEFTYAWHAHDGAVSWDAAGGSTASVTWDSPGAKQLRVVACRTGNPTEYINTTLSDVGPADTDLSQASGGDCAGAARTVHVADTTPKLAPWWKLPKDPIAVGESVDLEFSITRTNRVGGPGGITVSFPDLQLANSGDGSAPYESSQGKVTTVSYSGNNSQIDYLDSGITGTVEDADGNDVQPSYLIVATDNDQWPPPIVPPERKLKLRVTPEQAGEFRIYYRYWLCNEERRDEQGNPYCHHYPEPDNPDNGDGVTLDQQGWAVRVFTLTVVAPPVIESLGCDSDTVDIGATVTCSPTYGGGDIDSYDWRAGHAVAGGNPWSGSDATFSTSWSYSGQQTVSLAVCNEVSGCVSSEQTITVNSDPEATEPEQVLPPTTEKTEEDEEEDEEEEPADGGRVLISGLASQWAHADYLPTDTTIQVRVVPTEGTPTLEITIFDEDGFAGGAGEYISSSALVLALPEGVWVDYGSISTEMHIAGSWAEYSDELERNLMALETITGGGRTTASVLGLIPTTGEEALTAADRLAWGLGTTGDLDLDDIFEDSYANCVTQLTMPWLAVASRTTGVRMSVPVDLSTNDYVSLAAAVITAEGEDSEEAALLQVHDLLDTGDDAPGCAAPGSESE